MPVSDANGQPVWKHRTSKQMLLLWAGWLALVALFVFCWQVMTKDTIWMFVYDAPIQAADLGSRMFPPRWSYISKLWVPLWDTLNIATLGTLMGIIIAVPVAFMAARNTTPSLYIARPIALLSCVIASTSSWTTLARVASRWSSRTYKSIAASI